MLAVQQRVIITHCVASRIIEVSEFCFMVKTLFCGSFRDDLFSKKCLRSPAKSMVLRTFNFWGFCGPYRDFLYYLCTLSVLTQWKHWEWCKCIALCRTRLTNDKTSVFLRLNAFFSKNDVRCAKTRYFALKTRFMHTIGFNAMKALGIVQMP